MKPLLIVACVLLLCSCSSAPIVQSSFGGASFSSGPTNFNDPRLRQRQFYTDEGDSMPWLNAAPHTNR